MIFKKSIKYKGIKYTRVREDYRDASNIKPRCSLYNCRYKGKMKFCIKCREVMHITDAEIGLITFGYMPIN